MFLLLLAHFIVAIAAVTVWKTRPRVSAVAGIVVFSVTSVFALLWGVTDGDVVREQWDWLSALGLSITLEMDSLAVMMVLIVSILGAGVLAYSLSYFDSDETMSRFTSYFVAFAGVMSGLVMSADLFTMFLFWELTSVFSFLLIGLKSETSEARISALRALLVTSAGGLSLLTGVVLLQVAVGTTSFRELSDLAPTGTVVTTAAVLALVGAFTKSAQFPFHFWLPGAMAAPTPVSAYLHSATMVKAGIVLMARMSPIFGDLEVWRWMVVLAGGTTMIVGGVRAMRSYDAKLLLAHSTVSQLGFLTVLAGIGIPGATYAAVVHLAAHAVFKAALFLSVGVVDHSVGSRDIRSLNAVGRQMPFVAAMATLSAVSMAGIIPMFGFATKEKALAVLLKADDSVGAVGTVALILVVVGAVLSTAYSTRLIRGVFGTKPDVPETVVHHAPGFLLVAPVAVLSLASLFAGVFAADTGHLFDAVASTLNPAASGKLALWPGINTAFIVSVVVVVVGIAIGMSVRLAPSTYVFPMSGEKVYQWFIEGILIGSKKITKYSQTGSLQTYIVITMSIFGSALLWTMVSFDLPEVTDLVLADSWWELGVVVVAIAFSLVVTFVQQRFVAALVLGGVGYALAVLFVLYGSPDLALTQILVETIILVVFLLVLRQLPKVFDQTIKASRSVMNAVIALVVGISVTVFAVFVTSARTAPSIGDQFVEQSLPGGGGKNVVNVILVDFRGADTLGEITVLGVAALGVANLVLMARRRGRTLATVRAQ